MSAVKTGPTSSISVSAYFIGFILSLALTMAAYLLTIKHSASGLSLVFILLVLAVSQFIVQLIFFLHLGRERKPYWNLVVFIFMLGVLLTVVVGSLWIMHNLNHGHGYSHGNPGQTDQFIIHDENIK